MHTNTSKQRNKLLHELHLHQRPRHLRTPITHPCRLRIRRLPDLRLLGLLRNRTLRPAEGHDVVRGRVLHLLDLHFHCSGIVREGRRLIRPWLCRRGVLLRLLCVLRHGRARSAVAIPNRDQCSGNANER